MNDQTPVDPLGAPESPIETIHAAAAAIAGADQLTLNRDGVHALSLLLRVVAWHSEVNLFAAVEAAAVARAILAGAS